MEYNPQWSEAALNGKFWDIQWEFSVRLNNVLKDNFQPDITLKEMQSISNKELLALPNFGKITLIEFRHIVGYPNCIVPTCPTCHRPLE